MRLDEPKHGLDGDERVGGIAALPQHVEAGLRGVGVGSDDHLPLGMDRLLGLLSAAGLRRQDIRILLRKDRWTERRNKRKRKERHKRQSKAAPHQPAPF